MAMPSSPQGTLHVVRDVEPYLLCPACQHRIELSTTGARWAIRSPRDVADRMTIQMATLEREELHVLLLNAKNTVLGQQRVYQGNVSAALVRVAEVFREAVHTHAAGLIIVHNHPSGDPEPSVDDLHLTAEAIAAGRLLDIPVLDHLVVATGGYVSLRDRGVGFDPRPTGIGPANRKGITPW